MVFNTKTNTKHNFINALLIAVSAALLCKETLIVGQITYTGTALYLIVFIGTFTAYANSGIEKKIVYHIFNSVKNSFISIVIAIPFFVTLWFFTDHIISSTLGLITLLTLIYFEAVVLNRGFNIRKIYFAKSMLLGLVWSLATVTLPAAFAQAELFSWDMFFIFIRRLLFISALSLSFDIRDIKKDELLGYKNIASLIGTRKTKAIAIALLLLFAGMVGMQMELGSLSKTSALAMHVSIAIASIPILLYYPNKNSNLVLFIIDAMLIIQFLLIVLFNNY